MDQITRRRFLEQSLLITTAIAGGGFAEGTRAEPRPTRRVGANDKIHIACIGVNSRGMSHVQAYAGRSDVEIVAICDCDTRVIGRAQKAVTDKGKANPDAVQDIRKLLERKDLDAVSIATPNHWHSLAAIWAMQAGKDVYVEKPISHNIFEGRQAVETARKYKRICQAGTQSRSHKAMQDAMNYIHSGKIGKVLISRGLCYKRRMSIGKVTGAQPVPETVDYDLWLGPAPKKPVMRQKFHYDWHWFWDYGNGDMGNQGIHQMDVARWALNKNSLPISVMGLGGRFGYVDDGETPNTELNFYDYGDAQLIFETRGLKSDPYKGAMIGNIIHGTEGYVVFSDGYGRATAFDNNGTKVQEFTGGGDHFANFLTAVRTRKPTDLHAEILEGHRSSALCHLGNISYRLGAPQPFNPKTKAFGDNKDAYDALGRFEEHLVANGIELKAATYFLGPRLKFDPKTETFHGNDSADNDKANKLLTREYRAPFVVPEKV